MMMGGGRLFRSLYRPLIRPNISRSSSSSAGGTPSSIRYLTGAGAIVGGIVTYSYWYHGTNESPHVGIKVDYGNNNKIQQYEMEGSVHPEAEAEENLVPTTESVPAITKAEIDEDHRVPEFAPYVLIGGGTASFAAAKAIREKDPSAKVLIIGDEDYTPYSRPPLSKQLWYYEDHSAAKELRFTASWSRGKEVDVFYKMDFCPVNELMERDGGGVAMVTGRKVISLNPQAKKMILDDKREVKYNKCLLATGGRPRTLPIFDDSKFTGRVTTFRDIPDYKTLDGIVDKVGSVLVIGGGFLGSELAVGMRNRGRSKDINVIQLFPESGNLGLVLPKDVSQWTTNKVKAEGITVMSDVTVHEAGLDDGGRINITASDGQQVSVDHVVVAVGLQPNDELAKSGHLEIDGVYGGIKVNSELQACTDVWAAGDVASFYDPYLGRRRVEHHDHANVSGRLAGYNMTGSSLPFMHQSMFWSDVGSDVGFEATGIIDSKLSTVGVWSLPSAQESPLPPTNDDYSKGVIYYLDEERNGRIVGVLTWNIFGKMDVAKQIISEDKYEKDIADLNVHFDVHN